MVVFPKHLQTVASEVLVYAENALEKICGLFEASPPQKIRYLLHDFDDRANGSATFYPYNQIEIRYAPPDQESSLAGSLDWLNQLVVHETTHIVVFHQAPRSWLFLRKIFGHNPLLYPTTLIPRWMMEGLAIISESMFGKGGRLDTCDYGIMLKSLVEDGCMPSWRGFWGEYTRWPGPQAAYLFGAGFLAFLSEDMRLEPLRRIVKNFKEHPVPVQFLWGFLPWPYTSVDRFQDVFGLDIGDAWSRYLACLSKDKDLYQREGIVCLPLETSIAEKRFPLATPEGEVFFWGYDYKRYPGIYQMVGGKAKKVVSISGISGLDGDSLRLVFSAYQMDKTYRTTSDLYVFDRKKKEIQRVTRGARITYPSLRGNEILCVQKRSNGLSKLVVLSLDTKEAKDLGLSAENLAHPSWSADGDRLIVSAKDNGGRWRIACFKPGETVLYAPETNGNQFSPAWVGRNRILFLSESESGYKLILWRPEPSHNKTLTMITAPATIRAFAKTKGIEDLLVLTMSGRGYVLSRISEWMLGERPLDALFLPKATEEKRNLERKQKESDLFVRNYRALKDLLPKHISFAWRDGGVSYQPGVLTGGQDLTRRHRYNAEFYWDGVSRTPGLRFFYRYDGLKPTLGVDYYSLSASSRRILGGAEQFVSWRESRWRIFSQWWLFQGRRWRSDLQFGFSAQRFGGNNAEDESRVKTNFGLFSQFHTGNLSQMLDATAPQGLVAAFGAEFWPHFDGARAPGVKLTARTRIFYYLSKTMSTALQFNASHFWGERAQFLAMGGGYSVQNSDLFDGDLFGLHRAFPAGSFWGRGGWLVNSEIRFSLIKVEKHLGLVGTVNRILLCFFADIGNMWLSRPLLKPHISVGSELSARLQMAEMPMELSLGLAFPLEYERGARIYFRIGPSF